MPRDAELRFGLCALRMKFITRKQLFAATSLWLNDLDVAVLTGAAPRTLAGLLVESKYLDAAGCKAVQVALAAGGGAPVLEAGVRAALLDLCPPGDLEAWILGLAVGPDEAAVFRPVAREDRYEILAEIARGGLGRVMEARDRHLDREVAVKLVLDDMPPEARERFVREARLTARLDHPNIVPVHDFDELPAPGGGKKLMLCMKRVRGRDLGTLLRAIRRGDPEVAGRWSQARLLRVFQDICLGMAFAHSRGVLHRDLKPSNVMIGDYGETLIVDWGLAKEEGSGLEALRPTAGERSSSPELTLEGDLIGTPQYMSPEQAAGRISELDVRSDIFSLGGILYTILTHRPPFAGTTRQQVIESVLSGRVRAPSRVVEEAIASRESPAGREPSPAQTLPESVPPDLETICLKALAHRKEDRFASALALHDEVQLYLEGVKEREREHAAAEDAVRKAREAIERYGRLSEEATIASERARNKEREVKPLEDKTELWAAQDRARDLARQSVQAFADADGLLTIGLSHDNGHREARRLKAELFWGKFLEAEAREDEKEMLLLRRVAEWHNDGTLDVRLRGDGILTVRTRTYPCRCLEDGREIVPEEWAWLGYHPFSGRALNGWKGAEGLPDLEPREVVRVKVHGLCCEPQAIAGADVRVWRYEEVGRRLVPVTPRGAASGTGAPALPNGIFAPDSPFIAEGPGLYLGRTPIESHSLPMGSYLMVVSCDGFCPIRCPISISRCGTWVQDVTLFRPAEIPEDLVPIPAGAFGYQGDPENQFGEDAETVVLDDVFLARHPVSCREYRDFLADLRKSDPGGASRRAPREAEDSGSYWAGPEWAIPTSAWLTRASVDQRIRTRRLPTCAVDWDEDWPVLGVSWSDAMAYVAWIRRRDGRARTLPHEIVWEKAARGADRRYYPWGKYWDERWANGNRSVREGARPASIGDFHDDESPYGIRGLGGNSRDMCLNQPHAEAPGWRVSRGGAWADSPVHCRAAFRSGCTARSVYASYGFRMACAVRLSRPVQASVIPDSPSNRGGGDAGSQSHDPEPHTGRI